MKIYSVTAYRWGNRENHSYIVGLYDNLSTATCVAKAEEYDRGGKYECEVLAHKVNNDDMKIEKPIPLISDLKSITKLINKLIKIKESLELYENNNKNGDYE